MNLSLEKKRSNGKNEFDTEWDRSDAMVLSLNAGRGGRQWRSLESELRAARRTEGIGL